MYCEHCGNKIEDDSKFCPKCGMPTASTETQDVEASTKPNRPKWWFYVIVAIAAAAVIISFVFWARSTGRFNLNQDIVEKVDDNEETSVESIDDDSEDTTEVSDSTESEKITGISASATSQLDDYQGKTYSPYNLFDGDLETAYVEGVSGVGKGEEITITLDGEYEIDEIVWYPGYQISEDLLAKNGYPTKVTFYFSNGSSVESIENGSLRIGTSVIVPVDEEEVTDSITMVIDEAVAGYGYDDTCISEIELYGRKVS